MEEEQDQGGTEGMVPSGRLREETAAKRAALDRVHALEQELASARSKIQTVETLTGRVTELEQTLEAERASWLEERAIYQTGITDDEAISVARTLHSRLPEEGRPTLAEWLQAQAADPSKAVRGLQPYLAPPPEAPAGGGESGGARRTMGARRDTSGGSGGPPSGAKLSREQASSRLAKLAETATRTGDWTAYDRERPDLLEVISGG